MSLYPSVWRDSDCGSHFILWRNRIILLDAREENIGRQTGDEGGAAFRAAVLARIPATRFASYLQVAEALNEVPWEVLAACRNLVEEGVLREGASKRQGRFARVQRKRRLA
jgi:hypothetical protein